MATERGLRMATSMSTYQVLGTELSTLYALTLNLPSSPEGRYCYDPHEETAAQRGKITYPELEPSVRTKI